MATEGQAVKPAELRGSASGPVFLSYSRKDRQFVDRLARDLKTAGTDVWMDQSGIQAGRAWDDAVQGALDSASRVIVILSEHSVASPNVLDEVASALDSGKACAPGTLSKLYRASAAATLAVHRLSARLRKWPGGAQKRVRWREREWVPPLARVSPGHLFRSQGFAQATDRRRLDWGSGSAGGWALAVDGVAPRQFAAGDASPEARYLTGHREAARSIWR